MTLSTNQAPGHLFGPPAPVIVFTNGPHYLGEVRGHPSDIDAAHAKLRQHLEMLEPGPSGHVMRAMLAHGYTSRLSLGGHYHSMK